MPAVARLDPLLAITPATAIGKFLVDMRILSERAWRPWNKALLSALTECALPARARRVILDLNPIEDFFFAGVVAQQAARIRDLYPFAVAEALMRELALQADGAVGRGDNAVSSLAFIILGRIRKARAVENFRDHDQAVEAILERIGVGRDSATAGIMDSLPVRHKLAEPLALAAPPWWDSFVTIYAVDMPVPKPLPRRAGTAERLAERWRAAARAAQPTTASPFSFAVWLKNMRPSGDEIRPD